jgi:hypothetical protein
LRALSIVKIYLSPFGDSRFWKKIGASFFQMLDLHEISPDEGNHSWTGDEYFGIGKLIRRLL